MVSSFLFQICRRHAVMDAVGFLLEKAGDIQGAFNIMLEVCKSNQYSILLNLIELFLGLYYIQYLWDVAMCF